MAWEFVGSNSNSAVSGNGVTVSLAGLSLQEGDIVVAWAVAASDNVAAFLAITTSGYTNFFSAMRELDGSLGSDAGEALAAYKVMGETPDASVACNGSGDSSDACTLCVMAFRGGDPDTVPDVTATTASAPGSTSQPDPPSITPVSNNTVIIICGGTVISSGTAVPSGAPTNYGDLRTAVGNTTNDAASAMAWRELATAAAEDPAAWAGFTSSSAARFAATIALRPASSLQTLEPTLFTNQNTFHAPAIDFDAWAMVSWVQVYGASGLPLEGGQELTPALFDDSTDTFFAPTISATYTLTPAFFDDSADAFHAPTVAVGTITLTPGLFSDGDTFFAPTVTPGVVALSPALYTDGDTFFAPTVAPGEVALTAPFYTDDDTFFSHAVQADDASIAAPFYEDTDTFFAATITTGEVFVTPNLFSNAAVFFAPTALSLYGLTAPLHTDADQFFSPTVTPGEATITPSLYTDDDTFFAPTVAPVAVILTPALFTDADAFYEPSVAALNNLTPALYTDADAFYEPSVAVLNNLTPALYTDVDTFYAPSVAAGAVTLSPALFTDDDTFLQHRIGIIVPRRILTVNYY